MKLLDEYNKIQMEIFTYFGYVQNWRSIPLDDQRGKYWMICGPEYTNITKIVWSEKPLTIETVTEGIYIYSGSLYTQRHLPKWVYRGKDYTMICVDTHTDGNQFLMIFDNDKEYKDQDLKDLYNDCWKV
jgi:hypothetical protein